MKIEIEIPDGAIPDDMEPDGFRQIDPGEHYLDGGAVMRVLKNRSPQRTVFQYIALKYKRVWRPAKFADLETLASGGRVEARFRDRDTQCWERGLLEGWRSGLWFDSRAVPWNQCEVLDRPQ